MQKKLIRIVQKNLGVFTFIICSCVMIGIYFIGINVAESKQRQETTIKIAKQQEQIAKKELLKKAIQEETINMLTDWVYKQNNKIPRNLAKEIVIFTYQNCKYSKLVLGIIGRESNFDIFASRADTRVYGLGQIQHESWKDELLFLDIKESRDLFDWKKNILATDYIIKKYYEQEKSLDNALKKYVGAINKEMLEYRRGILTNIGELSMIEHEIVKYMLNNEPYFN